MKRFCISKKKIIFFYSVLLVLIFSTGFICYCENNTEPEYEIILDEVFQDDSVDKALSEVFGENRLSIEDIILKLLSGEETVVDVLWELIQTNFNGIGDYKNIFIKLLGLALICALFGFIPQIFGNEQTTQIGHFIAYITLTAFILATFSDAVTIVKNTVEIIIYLMNVIIPVYLVAVALTGSISTAGLSYEVFTIIIYFTQNIILTLIIPGVLIYLVMGLANELLESDKFTKLTELIKKSISWVLKGILTMLIGVQMLQGLITPYMDRFNTSVTKKTLEAIPGIGDITASGIEIAVGAALLVKNTVGVVGIIIILAAIAVPFLELFGYGIVFLLTSTLLQPVLQARVHKLFDVTVNAVKLLIRILLTVLLLFIISMALLAAKSGGGL